MLNFMTSSFMTSQECYNQLNVISSFPHSMVRYNEWRLMWNKVNEDSNLKDKLAKNEKLQKYNNELRFYYD